MTLQQRLVGSFSLVAVLLLIPTGLALMRLNVLRDMAVEGREQHAAASLALGRFETSLSDLDRLQRSYLVTGNQVILEDVQASLARLRAAIPPLREPAYLDAPSSLTVIVEGLGSSSDTIERLVRDGDLAEADEIFGGMHTLMSEGRRRLATLAEAIDRQAEEDFVRAHAIISSARATVLGLLVVCGILAVLLALWATRAVVAPARRLARAMADVTEGTLEAPEDLPYGRSDEIGDLSLSFRAMTLRLAELDRMKGEFLGVAGHELKTPIGVIAGYGALIEEELAGELTDHQEQILHGMVEQTRVVARLADRLMDIGRLESGAYRIELETVYLEDLLTGLVRCFDLTAQQKGVQIHTRIDASAPESVVLDVDLIRHEVLGNLVSNAIRFVPEGGEIRIDVRSDGGTVVFRIADNGPGIPPEHRPHVFDKYYQVKRSRKVGAGLGLAITREVVELHGGVVRLLDDTGPDTIFEVRLPAGDAAPRGADLPPPDDAGPGDGESEQAAAETSETTAVSTTSGP